MAIGDKTISVLSLSSGQTLNIQPSGTEEWVLHNLYHEDGITILRSGATYGVLFDTRTGKGHAANMQYHLKNSDYLAVRNDQIVSKKVVYDGVITKA